MNYLLIYLAGIAICLLSKPLSNPENHSDVFGVFIIAILWPLIVLPILSLIMCITLAFIILVVIEVIAKIFSRLL